MTMPRRPVLAALLAIGPALACAQDIKLHAYIDGRLVDAPSPASFTQGGLGKTRYGDGDTKPAFGGAALVATAQPTPALFVLADTQLQTTDRHGIELLEAYVRYRPVSLSRWRWSVQAGAFFPPISLENDALGWTSPWTLTPSAINSWVGEELRTIGAQASLQWRGEVNSLQASAALFRNDEAAGDILAKRGWSISDLAYGIGGRLRQANEGTQAERYDPFQRIGNRYGWHGDLTWRAPNETRVTLLRWDNRADASAFNTYDGGDRFHAWRTYFWSLGATTRSGPVTFIAQAIDGDTIVEPVSGKRSLTHFHSAFLLAGWNRGAWRPALRIEHFGTSGPDATTGTLGEHGNAVTAALVWRARDWLRFTGEVLRIDSTRIDLTADDRSPRQLVTQVQLGARLLY
jgi:hypothetical protein